MARIRTIKPEFWTDGNVVRLTPFARLMFIGTWNFALCDRGHLPDDPMGLKLKILPADPVDPDELVNELVLSGRLARGATADGRQFLHIVRFSDHQKLDPRWSTKCPYCAADSPTKDETPPASQGLAETRASHDEAPPNTPQEGKGREGTGEEKETSAKPPTDDPPPRIDVERLCNHLADRIEANGSSKRPTVTRAWRDAARLMLDRDSRTEEQIHDAIDWCQSDDFWHRHILSMPKLREKYEQLRLAAKPKSNGRPTNQHVESTAGNQLAEVFG